MATAQVRGLRLGIYTRASQDSDLDATSVDAQEQFGERWAERNKATSISRYQDNDRSASRYATKDRPDFERMLRDIAAGKLDAVWFWSLSRSQRRLDVYTQLRDLCQKQNVSWVIKNRRYDLNDSADKRALGTDAVNSEYQSDEISENTKLGLELAASRGKPHGPGTYGFRRVRDDRGKYVSTEPHPEFAPVVIEIIQRIAQGHPVTAIAKDFEARGVLTPSGGVVWRGATIRGIATNPAYIGTRVHKDKEYPGAWPAISSAPDFCEVFYRAVGVLEPRTKKSRKPARARHLLSFVARCECGEYLVARIDHKTAAQPEGRRTYACIRRCCSINADELDAYVRTGIDAYLARDDVREALSKAQSDDTEAIAARTEVAALTVEIEENTQARERREITLSEFVRFRKSLEDKLAGAQQRVTAASAPGLLIGWEVDWDNLPVARQVVAELFNIVVRQVGRQRGIPVEDRVAITPRTR